MNAALILALIAISTMGNSSCQLSPGAPEFNWTPKIYAADSGTSSIVRGSGSKRDQVKCAAPRFDDFVCVHKSEIRKATDAAIELSNKCERWKAE